MTKFHKISKAITLILFGGSIYYLIEILWRGHSHWTMFLLGGLMFFIIGQLNEHIEWDTPLLKQSLLGAIVVTISEFLTGCVVNLWLGWDIWDYSEVPFNILGQVCPQYFVLWISLACIAIIVDDYFRYFVFKEERPHYTFL